MSTMDKTCIMPRARTQAYHPGHRQFGESGAWGSRRKVAAAYNGHFGCMCYHPLFCFNQFGDCEGAVLRTRQRPQRRWLEGVHQSHRDERYLKLAVIERLNVEWIKRALAKTVHRRIILDIDSSESPVHGEQEEAAYNGHFGCMCYHPLFCFNQFGDCEGAVLRPGNVHSADGWKEFINPIVERYLKPSSRRCFCQA